ncbi:sulfatase-like hydrolase/transferase [Candidatus Uabimicrobium amorphum]|uniref:Sulfatase N-terminal domain-containing protein n=1 Tax=Uabimicrobium amorphum TaxID=2596890 RepID=A0A5S9IL43_UABAM|nr:sulfatase-like hydrolase/transferase [Candidatus Uabimicrobium amorphum]BBM83878.1 hypothetical protein UABAM_02233 [Candidatus Uabimicrobium amorphum]
MKKIAIFLCAFLLLNIVANIANVWQHHNVLFGLFVAPEIFAVLLALFITIEIFPSKNPWLYFVASTTIVLVTLCKLSFFAVPKFFHRSFNLYIDLAYIPDLLHFVYHSLPLWKFLLGSVVTVSVVGFLYWVLHKCLHCCTAEIKEHKKISLATMSFLLLLHASGVYVFHPSCVREIAAQVDFLNNKPHYENQYRQLIENVEETAKNTSYDLKYLRKNNVLLFFVESYGKTIFDKARHQQLLQPRLDSFSAMLKEKQYNVCSHFIISPTFGGNSWLAHGAMSCGVKTFNQIIFDMLLGSKLKTMAHYFRQAGYRAISVMPGTTKPWPAGKFFGFDQKYHAWHFDYRGPKYGWCTMTDQYVIDYIHREEVQKSSPPLFVEYVLISSHAPFHIQPPYIEDWKNLKDGALYHDTQTITYPIVWPNLSNATEGYVRSIDYVLHSIEDYLAQKIDDDSLIIVLGDHQPHGTITGSNPSWAVPIHIICRDSKLLEPFIRQGYTPGLIPTQKPPYTGMENFLYPFLQNFSSK